jgi:hypothetical protein
MFTGSRPKSEEDTMTSFVSRHASKIIGVLRGFDRLVFRGTLRHLCHADGMKGFLWHKRVLLKDFKPFALQVTEALKAASLHQAETLGRPIRYLESSQTSKEDLARKILEEHPVESGLICVLKVVEPCYTFEVHRSREKKRLELRHKRGKCMHLYHYCLDPDFGFMNARIQTWFPFSIQICVNGRSWLRQQLDRAGMHYLQEGNCFPWIQSIPRAQRLLDRLVNRAWPRTLQRFLALVNPVHRRIVSPLSMPYYWTVHQSEWATDVMFEDEEALAAIYPSLVRHAITSFSCRDVLRFLGRKLHPLFQGEATSDYKDRPEGIRVKHRVKRNSVKMYDKERTILRVETTLNDPADFKVFRSKQGDDNGTLAWRNMRKGVADIHRRAQVSSAANDRYLEALATVQDKTPLQDIIKDVQRRANLKNQSVRALRIWDADEARLLRAVGAGEFVANGFRNRDIVQRLFPNTKNQDLRKKRGAHITRKLRILRAHGVIQKQRGTYRYVVTNKGQRLIAAVSASLEANINALLEAA